jgi:hypothetical protein
MTANHRDSISGRHGKPIPFQIIIDNGERSLNFAYFLKSIKSENSLIATIRKVEMEVYRLGSFTVNPIVVLD